MTLILSFQVSKELPSLQKRLNALIRNLLPFRKLIKKFNVYSFKQYIIFKKLV